MPEYSYRCTGEDKHITTESYPMGKAPELITCPECQKPARRKLPRPTIVIVNGRTDNQGNREPNSVK